MERFFLFDWKEKWDNKKCNLYKFTPIILKKYILKKQTNNHQP